MKKYFLTHIAPKDKVLEYKVSSAACNFSYNLISGNAFDKVYSILPTFVFGKKQFPLEGDVEYIYSSWRWGGKILRKLAPLRENFSLFRKIERGSSVWLYNLGVLNVWLVLLLRWFKPSVKINVIVLDFAPEKKHNEFFLQQINKCHGRILLANSPLFKKENAVVLPGVTPNKDVDYPEISELNKEFLISGELGENIAMTSMLLEAFSKMPSFTLHITGVTADDSKIKEFSSRYKNIIYHGCVAYEDYLDILHNTPFLFSTRNPASPENQCNFPSKIIEALLHNRIVISTLHYDQLDGIKYFEVPATLEGFIETLMNIAQMDKELLICYANQSNLVKELFNTNVWNKTMRKIEGK